MADDLGPGPGAAGAADLGSAVDAARVAGFVGRAVERAVFHAALGSADPPRVLYLHGPGGIGKTTLLHRYRIAAQRAGRPVLVLDTRDIDCTPDGFLGVWDARGSSSTVLLVDGYDRLRPIDDWFRDEFLIRLPTNSVVAVAGREAPAAAWRVDPGWRMLARCLPLTTLAEPDGRELLARVGVPPAGRDRLVELSHGHPLTLAMLAHVARDRDVVETLADAPDLVASLAATLVGGLSDEGQALACGLCAQAWLTTQDLLRDLVGDRAPELWEWLETRPYVTRGPDGLYPHDLVRDVLELDLRRRRPELYRTIHRVVHQRAIAQMQAPDLGQRQLWGSQLIHLHPRSPFASAYWVLRERGSAAVTAGAAADHAEVVEMVGRIQGNRSGALARRWLDRQPQGLWVIRSRDGRVAGFSFDAMFAAEPAVPDEDPVLAAARAVIRRAPARPGELVGVSRFTGGRDGERDPHAILVASTTSLVTWVTQPLAWSVIAVLDLPCWGPIFDYIGFGVLGRVDCDGRTFTLFGHDWRRLPPQRWVEAMGERELTGRSGPFPESMLRPAPLGRSEFDDAVRAALRSLTSTEELRRNPLAGSRVAGIGDDDPGAALRAAILAGVQRLAGDPTTRAAARVLHRTFVRPAPSQEAAAQVLGLPFSTYRRHLAKAVQALADLLWAVEIGQESLDPTT
ncbi:ATP-binding protein [Nakamurella sp.]|uniref:ATP-binding protein n=1 Tax=Nakamurella sp. TaxID=1869182 RepID=UPI003782D79D